MVVSFKIVSRHFATGTEENNEEAQDVRYPGRDLNPGPTAVNSNETPLKVSTHEMSGAVCVRKILQTDNETESL
jgi:hypothetical protein